MLVAGLIDLVLANLFVVPYVRAAPGRIGHPTITNPFPGRGIHRLPGARLPIPPAPTVTPGEAHSAGAVLPRGQRGEHRARSSRPIGVDRIVIRTSPRPARWRAP